MLMSVVTLDTEHGCYGGDRADRADGRHGGESYCGGGCNNKIFSFTSAHMLSIRS